MSVLQSGIIGALTGSSVLVVVLGVILAALYSSIEIVNAYEKKTLTVLGEYRESLEPGFNFIPPFVSKTYPFDMRTQTIDVKRQEAITRDNSPVTADAVVYVKVMDSEKAFLEVDDYKDATSSLAQTTLRAVIGDMELDDTLNKRQQINARIQDELAEPTDEWGVSVESVEVREVNPSQDVQEAMEKQTSAERRRRAMILEAEGERQSSIEEAEGDKQSNIIRAQGEKQSQILEAQGEALSTVLRARSAQAMGERAIIERGMETLESIGQGDSTKFIIPQELSSMLGRYGKSLTGSTVANDEEGLEALEFDEGTEELLGLDNIEELAGELDKVEEQLDSVNPDVDDIEPEVGDIEPDIDTSGLDSSDMNTEESE